MKAEVFEQEIQKRYHLRSFWRSVVPVTVRRWHRSEATEGRWEGLTKCGVTKCMTYHRRRYGPSWWFVVMIREVVPVPKFQRVLVLWNEDPRQTVVPVTIRHTCRRG